MESGRTVVITRDNASHAVLVPIEGFESHMEESDTHPIADALRLETLMAEDDAMLEKMQTPEVRAATRRAFSASAEELARAAVEAARQKKG